MKWTTTPVLRALLAALTVVAWSVAVWLATHASRAVDLGVYRAAVAAWRRGLPLYDAGFPYGLGVRLPFTYPPFGLLPFSVLAAVPMTVALALVVSLGLVAVAVTTRLSWGAEGSLGEASRWHRPRPAALAVLAVSAALEPFVSSFYFGQVNVVLMGLVAADLLLPRTPWPRGLLVGLCAAIKLTPMVFLLFLLGRRDWRAAGWTVASFLVASGVGALVLPRDSATYWFSVLLDPDRVGSVHFAANQSMRAVISRLGPEPAVGTALWLIAVVVVLGFAVAGIRARHRCGDVLGALVVTAATGLLVSPVSWNHHYVWCLPALVWLVRRARAAPEQASVRWWWAAGVTAAIFVVAPYRLLPSGDDLELTWSWWQHLVGDAYVWAALALVGWAAADAVRSRTRPEGTWANVGR